MTSHDGPSQTMGSDYLLLMKYIITESQIENIVKNYLDLFLKGKEIAHIPEADDDEAWKTRRGNANPLIEIYEHGEEVVWYEFNTELLWVDESIFNTVKLMFSLTTKMAEKQIGKWFGSTFNVRVDRVQHSS